MCEQIRLRMILLIESHIRSGRRVMASPSNHRHTSTELIWVEPSHTIIRNYMSMLVYDPNNVQPVYCERNGYEAILIQQPIRQNTLAPDECSGSVRACALAAARTENYYLFHLLCPCREGAERTHTESHIRTIVRLHIMHLLDRKPVEMFICARNEAERITIINGQCTPCDLEAHGEFESLAMPEICARRKKCDDERYAAAAAAEKWKTLINKNYDQI